MNNERNIEKILDFIDKKDFDILDYLNLQKEIQEIIITSVSEDDIDEEELDDDLDDDDEPEEEEEEQKTPSKEYLKKDTPPSVPEKPKIDKIRV